MGGVWAWWLSLGLFSAAQGQAGQHDEYKILDFKNNNGDPPTGNENLKTYAKKLWDATYADYTTTMARLDYERNSEYTKYGAKLDGIVMGLKTGVDKLTDLEKNRLAVKASFDQRKQYWAKSSADNDVQVESLRNTYEQGYAEDYEAQRRSFFGAENKAVKKLQGIGITIASIKEAAERTRKALAQKVEYKAEYFNGLVAQLNKEREADVTAATAYDSKRKNRALRLESKTLADAMSLQLRVKDTVDTMYQEIDKAADKVVNVVASRVKLVDDTDSAMMKTESDGIEMLENTAKRSVEEVAGKYGAALGEQEDSVKSLEEKMELKMRQVEKNMDREFSGIAQDLDGTDTALENGLLKVDGAGNKVLDARQALVRGKQSVAKIMEKYREGVLDDRDTAKGIFDSELKAMKTNLNMRIALQKQRAQTEGMKSLNAENAVFGEAMDQMNRDEDARKENVKKEMDLAELKGEEVSNKTRDYATYVKDVIQNTTNARGNIDRMKADMLKAIEKDNGELEQDISERSHKIENEAGKVPTEVASIKDVAEQVMTGMGPVLKATWLRDIPAAKTKVNIKIAPLDVELQEWKRGLSTWMRSNLDKIQHTVEKTGKLINQVMPALKSSARKSAEGVLRDVQKIEDELKAGSQAAYTRAAEDEHKLSQRFIADAEKTRVKLMKGLKQDDGAVTKWARSLAVKIAERKAELKKGQDTMVSNFNQSLQGSRDVSMDIQRTIIKLKAEILSSKSIASKLAGPETEEKKELQNALDDALANMKKALALQEVNAKAEMEKYSTEVKTAAEEREHKVTEASSEASAEATKTFMTMQDRYTDLFEKAFEDLRVLSVRMQGLPANESEWSKALSSKKSETAAAAKDFELLVGKSKLEQQAHIDEKFRSLGAVLEQSVKGLADSKRAVLQKLAHKAKQEMERAVHQGKLTGEQLGERMQSLMGWLQSQVAHSEDMVGESLDSANNTQEFWNGVEEDAEARAQSLMTLVAEEDAAANVKHDRDMFTSTHAAMSSLLSDLEHTVDKAKADATAKAEDLETAHTFHALQMKNKYSRQASDMTTEMAAEEDKQTDQLKQTQQSLERHESVTGDMAALIDAGVKDFDARAYQRMEALADHSVEREKTQRRVKAFVNGLQTMSAETLYNAADVMIGLLDAGKTHLGSQAEDVAAVAKELELAMGTEHFQVLQGLGRLDKRLDAMLERNNERALEQKDVETTMSAWRTNVARAVDGLGGSLGHELEALRKQGLGFEQHVKVDAAGMSKQQQDAVDAIGKEVASTIVDDQQKLEDHQHDFNAQGPTGELVGAQDTISLDTPDNSDTHAMEQNHQDIENKASKASRENDNLDQQQAQYLNNEMAKATGTRSDLRTNLATLASSISSGASNTGSSMMQVEEPVLLAGQSTDGPPSDDVQAALRVNTELLAQHSLLEQRLHALVGNTTDSTGSTGRV